MGSLLTAWYTKVCLVDCRLIGCPPAGYTVENGQPWPGYLVILFTRACGVDHGHLVSSCCHVGRVAQPADRQAMAA